MTFHTFASGERIAFVTSGTSAVSFVVATVTLGISSARIFQNTRIYTFSIEALLVVGTFIV